MWLSYIIPLYNCGLWIGECLDSLLCQGLEPEDYEVIVVNDGSTDGGEKIVERYCCDHANFRLLNQENQGVSAARNRGMDEAKGEYLCFVDADDWLAEGGGKILRRAMSQTALSQPDLIGYQYNYMSYNKKTKPVCGGKVLSIGPLFAIKSPQLMVWVWLFRKSLIDVLHLRFEPLLYEDNMFMLRLLSSCPNATVLATDFNIYCYRQRANSTVHCKLPKHIERVCESEIIVVSVMRSLHHGGIFSFEYPIRHKVCDFPISLLSTSLPYSTIKRLCRDAMAKGFYQPEDLVNPVVRLCCFFIRHPLLLKLASYPKRYIYDRYIRRNECTD